MQINIKFKVDSNPNLKKYLKENSYWYHYLNRNPLYLKLMEEEMKKRYKLTTKDKISKISDNINMINEILKILN